MKEGLLKSYALASVTLCADQEHAIDTTGWAFPAGGDARLVPDETVAYMKFKMCGAATAKDGKLLGGRTSYGTSLHPSTIANSFRSLRNKPINDRHMMRVHDPENPNARDHVIGGIVAFDFPRPPYGGWALTSEADEAPIVTAVASLYKQVKRVPEILKEHLGGIHQWTMSQEIYFDRMESGFAIEVAAQQRRPIKRVTELMEASPAEFKRLGLGYVPFASAPEDMLKCYDPGEKGMKKDWEECRLTLFKGGVNGSVHWGGAAVVPYGAEREAEIMDLLCRDAGLESPANPQAGKPALRDAEMAAAYRQFFADGKKVVDALRDVCLAEGTR